MDESISWGLINSISRFIHLVSCQTIQSSALNDFRNIVGLLKLLKPILDEAFDSELPSDGHLMQAFEFLDTAINEAREFVEKMPNRKSKIYTVLQSEPIVLKVRKAVTEICCILSKLSESSSYSLQSADLQHCLQELQYSEQNMTSELIEHALRDLRENTVPSIEDVIKIMDNLGLSSNEELLLENIALEKQRIKAELKDNTEESDHIDEIILLVTHIRHCVAKLEQFGFINGLPVPAHFCCPLSLHLMQDPVIVASGQTYERSFIQKWLDHGLRVCPKTRKSLTHMNLISNYTVKALIANWCEDNKIKLGYSSHFENSPSMSIIPLNSFRDGNGFCEQQPMFSASISLFECHDKVEEQVNNVSSDIGGEESCLVNHQGLPANGSLQNNVSIGKKSCQSHSESLSSVISSIDISRSDEKVSLLGAVTNLSLSSSDNHHASSAWSSLNQHNSFKSECYNSIDSKSSPSIANFDDPTTSSHVQRLIGDMKSQTPELQAAAASEIRLLAKHNMENRALIADCGAVPPLVTLLHSKVKRVQENAVTALLNLSINNDNKVLIAEAGAIEPLIYVLECGSTEARENSAAALFSLSSLEEYKIKIGRSGAVKALVNLLASGSLRGKKDAATALFNLSIFHENRARIIQAGAVKCLIKLMDPSTGMLDKSLAVLVNLSMITEGRLAIVQEDGIPLLVEVVESGSQRGKENAASTLLQLCLHSQKFCNLVLQEGAVPPLIALSQFGTPRAKEKAQQILSHFRSQREGKGRRE